jgi:hypothetical protein
MVNLDASESLDHSTATTPETGVKVSASDRRVRDEGPRLLGSVWHHLGTVGVDMAFFVAAWKSCRCVVASCKFVGGDSASYHSVDVRNIERIGVRWKPYQLAFKKDHSMKEYPILFSGPMVRAILEGRKTQTRRVVKPQPVGNQRIVEGAAHLTVGMNPADDGGVWYATDCVNPGTEIRCPYGVPGDRLWVRETWAARSDCEPGTAKAKHYLMYRAEGGDPADPMNWHDWGGRWRPLIHMPRWACRLVLEITSVRVERLQDITDEDARKEGVAITDYYAMSRHPHRSSFIDLWDSIYGTWNLNPYVWVVEFRKVEDKR